MTERMTAKDPPQASCATQHLYAGLGESWIHSAGDVGEMQVGGMDEETAHSH